MNIDPFSLAKPKVGRHITILQADAGQKQIHRLSSQDGGGVCNPVQDLDVCLGEGKTLSVVRRRVSAHKRSDFRISTDLKLCGIMVLQLQHVLSTAGSATTTGIPVGRRRVGA